MRTGRTLPAAQCLAILLVVAGLSSGPACGQSCHPSFPYRFIRAAEQGNTSKIKELLAIGDGLAARTWYAGRALTAAGSKGHLEIIKMLVRNRVDINAVEDPRYTKSLAFRRCGRDSQGVSALMAAIQSGQKHIAPDLIEMGADVNFRSPFGVPVLKKAIDCGDVDLVRLLLDKGTSVSVTLANDRSTPLMWAAANGAADICRLLMDKGVGVNEEDSEGSTALKWAAIMEHRDVARLLIAHGAEVTLPIATMLGNREAVKRLIKDGANVNARDSTGWTPVMYAARKGHKDLLKLLLEHGADVKAIREDGSTALIDAVSSGDLEVLRRLLEASAETGLRGNEPPDGTREWRSPLCYAATRARLDMVKLLLKNGADVNERDADGFYPLEIACDEGELELAKLLLDTGADANCSTSGGHTPLMLACQRNYLDMAKLLLENGADVGAVNSYGDTALQIACENGRLELARLLVSHGANADAPKKPRPIPPMPGEAVTPLQAATHTGNAELVKLIESKLAESSDKAASDAEPPGLTRTALTRIRRAGSFMWHGFQGLFEQSEFERELCETCYPLSLEKVMMLVEQGADVNARCSGNYTPLETAAMWRSSEVVRFLLEQGADVHVRGPLRHVPLNYNVWCLKPDVVKMLLDRDADINVRNKHGDTPLGYAVSCGHPGVVSMLLNSGATVTDVFGVFDVGLLFGALRSGHIDAFKLLLEKMPDVNIKTDDGWTALHYAARCRDLEAAHVLLQRGADVNARSPSGWTALMLGARSPDVLRLLLKHGADPSAIADNGETALLSAISAGDTEGVRLLIKMGADVNARSSSGYTPLIRAARTYDLKTVETLVALGANVDVRAKDGVTPLMASQSWAPRTEVSGFLKAQGAKE